MYKVGDIVKVIKCPEWDSYIGISGEVVEVGKDKSCGFDCTIFHKPNDDLTFNFDELSLIKTRLTSLPKNAAKRTQQSKLYTFLSGE